MINLHVTITSFVGESRVEKQASSIISNNVVKEVHIAAKHKDGLKEHEKYADNIFVNRVKLKSIKNSKSMFAQGIKYVEFIFKILLCYRKKKVSFLTLHSYSLLPLALLFRVFYRSYIIYDAHELETETVGLKGTRKKLAKLLERILIYFVDEVVVVSDSIADWYRKSYSLQNVHVIYNYPEVNGILSKGSDCNLLREEFGIDKNKIILLYQGGLLKARGVDKLLEAFVNSKSENVVIVFMGNGELAEKIRQASLTSKKVFYKPAVTRDVLLNYTQSADIGIHIIPNNCLNHDYCMPNKLFEYLNAGLPVIVSDVKDMSNFVLKNKVGLSVNAEHSTHISELVDKLNFEDFKNMKENIATISGRIHWSAQETDFIRVYNKVSK